MKVRDAIEMLRNYHSEDEDIIIGWWSHDQFHKYGITKKEWRQVCEELDDLTDEACKSVWNTIVYTAQRL